MVQIVPLADFSYTGGVENTNNPIELFNKLINKVYTNFKLYSVYQFILILLQKLINQYSYQSKEFSYYHSLCYETIQKAIKICHDE